MAELLETNVHGQVILTAGRARELARNGAVGTWYTAPFARQWTVGLISAHDYAHHHVLDEQGVPLSFEYEWDAWEYLRRELKVPSWKLPPAPQKPAGQAIPLSPGLPHHLMALGASAREHR